MVTIKGVSFVYEAGSVDEGGNGLNFYRYDLKHREVTGLIYIKMS